MLPTTLAQGYSKVVQELRVEEFVDVLNPLFRFDGGREITPDERAAFDRLVFAANRSIYKLQEDPLTDYIVKKYELNDIFSEDKLGDYIKTFGGFTHTSHLTQQPPKVYTLARLNERLRALVFTHQMLSETITSRESPKVEDGETTMRLIISERGDGVLLARFSRVIDNLTSTFEGVASADGGVIFPPRIIAIESGSDILLLVTVSATAAILVTKALTQVNRLRLEYKFADLQLENKVIKDRIEVMKDLHSLGVARGMEASDIEALQHRLTQGVVEMLDDGLKMKGMADDLLPEQKLLTNSSSEEQGSGVVDTDVEK